MRGLSLMLAWALAGIAASVPSEAAAGELAKVRKQVRPSGSSSARRSGGSASRPARRPTLHRPTPRSPSQTHARSSQTHVDTHHVHVHYAPAPRHATGHAVLAAPQLPTVGRYNRSPYDRDTDGLIVRVPHADKAKIGRMWSAQLSAEVGSLGKTLWKTGFGFDADYWRVGLSSDLDWVVQGQFEDAMYLGSTNARVTVIMRPRLRLRAGGGTQYMIDGRTPGQGTREYATGPNLTADVEVFPFKPLTLSARLDYGTLYKTPSGFAQAAAGVVFRGVQVYVGYEFRRIGSATLYGPAAGLRLWF